MEKKVLNVASTVLATGIAISLMSNSTPVVTLEQDFVKKLNYYSEANPLGISNVSYNYMKSNVYYSHSVSKIENEAYQLFGRMRDATEQELGYVNDYISSISKETGVDFWDLC